jgi:hypothetical protein
MDRQPSASNVSRARGSRNAWLAGAALLLAAASGAGAQQAGFPSRFSPDLSRRPAVRDALAWLEADFARHGEGWVRITEIPAKSGHEQRRAA